MQLSNTKAEEYDFVLLRHQAKKIKTNKKKPNTPNQKNLTTNKNKTHQNPKPN